MMTQCLAREWARKGINVNALCPGFIETELNGEWFASDKGKAQIEGFPRKRLAQDSDLDGMFLLLASDASRAITGTLLTVDDGQALERGILILGKKLPERRPKGGTRRQPARYGDCSVEGGMRRPLRTRACIAMVGVLGLSAGAGAQSVPDLQQMSIDQLQNLDVTSVTRTSEALGDAPAAVYVVTHDAIVRSGAVTVPEILRLAPNLQVDQISANHYVITARGFSGNIPDQSFANQLLVLIDGRSVYNPIFSGVYWDMQDLVPEDIERIEVISGPGATLWGANAVNGVINITTRRAADTQGGLISPLGRQSRTERLAALWRDAVRRPRLSRPICANIRATTR